MLTYHLKLAWRQLAKHPGYALLNVGGLALGIAAAFVLGLYVRQELTYDRHFDDSDRIYRITTDFFGMGGFAPSQEQLLDVLPEAAPAVEQATRFTQGYESTLVTVGEASYEEADYLFVDSAYFQVFSHRFVEGTPATVLQAPEEVVLSEALAQKYFGAAPAVGQVILVGWDQQPKRVSGVVAAPTGKTHLVSEMWLPLEPAEPELHWSNATYFNYVKLRPGATQADLERGLDTVLRQHAYPASGFAGSFEEWHEATGAIRLDAQPLTDIYLHSDLNFELVPGGNPAQVTILGLVGLLIVLIAGMNYVNLTTARASIRTREVGVKKTMGAGQPALVRQFLAETVGLSVLATLLAAGLAEGMLAAFAYVTGEVLVESLFAEPEHVAGLLGFSVVVGVMAGLYPAFYLARFRPATILKGAWRLRGNRRLRGALVVVQFALAIILVSSSLVVYRQLDFLQHTDKGFAPDGVLAITNAGALGPQQEAFREALGRLPAVEQTSFARRVPTGSGVWMRTYQTPEMEKAITIQTFPADEHYLATLGMRLVAGRNFSAELASDSNAVILNETAVRALQLGDDPLGKEIRGRHVVGVISDFNFQSLRQRIEPVVVSYAAGGGQLVVKLRGAGLAGFMDQLSDLWETFAPATPLRYAFLDDNFAQLAARERMLSRAVAFFTLLALLIAAMGLFGLAAFTAEQRTKEIGMRKVLGASVASVVGLLTKDVLKLVVVAFLVGAPIAYLAAARWLSDFAYHIDLGAGVFVLAGTLAALIAWLTVSYQSIRAALADPVKALRYE